MSTADGKSPHRRFRFRKRTLAAIFLGLLSLASLLWIVFVQEAPESSLFLWAGLTFIVYPILTGYLHRHSQCPKCGEYALAEKGNYFGNLVRDMVTSKSDYFEHCQNCSYVEWHEAPEQDPTS